MPLFRNRPAKKANIETLCAIFHLDPEFSHDPEFYRIRFSKRKAGRVIAITIGLMLALVGAIHLLRVFLLPAHTSSEGSNIQSHTQVRSTK